MIFDIQFFLDYVVIVALVSVCRCRYVCAMLVYYIGGIEGERIFTVYSGGLGGLQEVLMLSASVRCLYMLYKSTL